MNINQIVDELEDYVAYNESVIRTYQSAEAGYLDKIQDLERVIDVKSDEIDEKDLKIEDLEEQIQDLEEEIAQLKAQLNEKTSA